MKNILLTGVGGVTPQSIAKSLRLSKERYRLVGVDCSASCNGLYMDDLFDKTYCVPRCTDPGYYDAINRVIEAEGSDLMIVSPDFEVREVSANRERIHTRLILPEDSFIQVITNKVSTYRFLEDTGLVPGFLLISSEEDLRGARERFGAPFWVRQFVGTSGLGSLKITDLDQAKFWIDYNKGWGKFMAAEYLPGKNFGFQLLFDRGALVTSACYERKEYIMAKVAPSGISGNAAWGEFVHRGDVNRIGVGAVEAICRKLGVEPHGMLTVDLKEDRNGVPKVTEINPRHIAPTYCFAQAGVNFAELMVRVGLGQPVSGVPPYDAINPNCCLLRGVDAEPVVMPRARMEWKLREMELPPAP